VKKIGERYEAVFGNRRIVAAKRLGWADIPAHILQAETDNDRDILNLIENIKRQNTTVAEDGRIFDALEARGLSTDEISVRVGVSRVRVETALSVFRDVPKEYRPVIVNRVSGRKEKGTISATAAHKILQLRKQNGLNRKQTRALLDYAKKDDTSTGHLEQIAPLLKMGISVARAIEKSEQLERLTLFFFVDKKLIKTLEKKYNKDIRDIIWVKLAELKPAYETTAHYKNQEDPRVK
jgi:ParB/RepB/Spo0J family partition protein